MSPPTHLEGLVLKAQSGFFSVQTTHGLYVCQAPKRLKHAIRQQQQTQERPLSDLVAVGDHVTLRVTDAGRQKGVIEAVAERQTVLSRTRPAPSGRSWLHDREQVIIANPDQALFVFAIRDPEPNLRKLDRFLVAAEKNRLPAIICVNKIDLAPPGEAQRHFQLYARLGYRVIYTSAQRGDGLEELKAALRHKVSVLTGSSGVGKSSLLNALEPGLGLRVSAVSAATTKGRHTTRHTELIPLAEGGYVADTPGIRSLALYDVEPAELDAYFREIAPLVAQCAFSNCSHTHEEGCAVRAAVAGGAITSERYDSYLRLRQEHDDLEESAY